MNADANRHLGNLSRRNFLKTAAGGAIAATTSLISSERAEVAGAEAGPRIKSHRRLGKTELKVSDVSIGTYRVTSPEVIDAALRAGVDYIDTGPAYGGAEKIIGEVMRKHKRDEVVIATRWYTIGKHSSANLLESLDKSLKRLRTDYADIIFVGSANEVENVNTPQLHDAIEKAKKSGKARFAGVAGHSNKLIEVMSYAIESGRFEVIMPAFNFMQWPKLNGLLKKAKEKDIGVVAMKTQAGAKQARLAGFEKEKKTFPQAAIAWALKNPAVATVCITMKNFDHVTDYIGASGVKLGAWHRKTLQKYAQLAGKDYCRPGCSECQRSYSGKVRVNDVMRCLMYFEDYGLEKAAMEEYALLPQAAVGDFDGLEECPFGVDVKLKLARARELLSFG